MVNIVRQLQHRPNRLWRFFITESMLLLISYCCGIFFVVFNLEIIYEHWFKYFLLSFFHIVLVQSFMLLFGLYSHVTLYRKHERIPRLLLALMSAFFISVQLVYIFSFLDLGHEVWVTIYLLSILLLMIGRHTRINIGEDKYFKRHILILGAGKKAYQMDKHFGDSSLTTVIYGYIHIPGEREHVDKNKIIYGIKKIQHIVKEKKIDEIVVAMDDRRNNFPLAQLLEIKFTGIEIIDVLKFYERECGYIKLDIIEPSFLIFSEGFYSVKWNKFCKRLLDINCAVLILMCLAPVILLCMLFILIVGKYKRAVFKKIIYVGMNGSRFNKYFFNLDNKGIGAFSVIKKKIYSLPQWFNVLSGHLSVVGPVAKELQDYEEGLKNIHYYEVRTIVKPGLVGWFDLKKSAENWNEKKDKEVEFQYDMYYIKNQNFFLDFIIFISCYPLILKNRNPNILYKALKNY